MKRILLYLLVFVCHFSFAQTWFPEGASWYYDEVFFAPTNIQEGYIHFEISGTSVIQGKTCSRLVKSHQLDCYGRPSEEYLYEDNDVVYAFNDEAQEFQILYDFSLSAGGTWIVHPYQQAATNDSLLVTVDSTDVVTINSVQLKRMYLSYEYYSDDINFNGMIYQAVALEKIGDLRYLFNYSNSTSFSCDVNGTNGLRCYSDINFGLYETGTAPYCDYIAFVGTEELSTVNSEVYPNPTNSSFEIHADHEELENIQLFDLLGADVTGDVQFEIVSNELVRVSVEKLKAGVYLLKTTTKLVKVTVY